MGLAWKLEHMKELVVEVWGEKASVVLQRPKEENQKRKCWIASDVAQGTNQIRIWKDPLDLTIKNTLVTLAKAVLGEYV